MKLSMLSMLTYNHHQACLENRWCSGCNAWWCEACYTPPNPLTQAEFPKPARWDGSIKIHLGLCVEKCLISELYSGAGEGGMWG